MHWRAGSLFLLAVALILGTAACRKSPESVRSPEKLQVVATLFPLYDFARTVGGDRVQVTLLLPPGVEAHSYDPRPEDMARIAHVLGTEGDKVFTRTDLHMIVLALSAAARSLAGRAGARPLAAPGI